MHGRVFSIKHIENQNIEVQASFGGLLCRMRGEQSQLEALQCDMMWVHKTSLHLLLLLISFSYFISVHQLNSALYCVFDSDYLHVCAAFRVDIDFSICIHPLQDPWSTLILMIVILLPQTFNTWMRMPPLPLPFPLSTSFSSTFLLIFLSLHFPPLLSFLLLSSPLLTFSHHSSLLLHYPQLSIWDLWRIFNLRTAALSVSSSLVFAPRVTYLSFMKSLILTVLNFPFSIGFTF